MSVKFDPDNLRKHLVDLIVASSRRIDLSWAVENRALEGCGVSILDCCLQCFLVGLFDFGNELLPKAQEFFRAAVDSGEIPRRYQHGGTEQIRFKNFALCNWLLNGRNDLQHLKESVRWAEVGFAEHGDDDAPDVQLSLAPYLEAEEYEVLIARFEHAKLKPPKRMSSIRSEGTMAYVLAKYRLGASYTESDAQAALNAFLKRCVPAWLGHQGNYRAVARWMKIAFWKPGDDPIAAYLKCYDYLPFDPPPYAPSAVAGTT